MGCGKEHTDNQDVLLHAAFPVEHYHNVWWLKVSLQGVISPMMDMPSITYRTKRSARMMAVIRDNSIVTSAFNQHSAATFRFRIMPFASMMARSAE